MRKIIFGFLLLFTIVSVNAQCALGVFKNSIEFAKEGGEGVQEYFDFLDPVADCEVISFDNPASWVTVDLYKVNIVAESQYVVGYNLTCQPNTGAARSVSITFANRSGVTVSVLVTQLAGFVSELVFRYDASGNQIVREFKTNAPSSSAKQLIETTEEQSIASISSEKANILDQIKVYPNPTEGLLKLEWNPSLTKSIQRITASQASGITWEIPIVNSNQNFVEVDLTQNANGVYIISFELTDNKRVTKKIIKNQN